ncbi:Thymocyte nuclear protein 1 [Lemmus lemmus]
MAPKNCIFYTVREGALVSSRHSEDPPGSASSKAVEDKSCFCTSGYLQPPAEGMPRTRKRLTGPDKKERSDKRTKTESSEDTSTKLESPSPQKTSTSKNGGKNSSNYWLMKSEPESRLEKGVDVKFSIEDLKAQPKQTACWDGVRNYQARNFLRTMKLDEEAFFYHSNCKQPGIVGLMKIVKEAYPDHTQFEKNNPHYDPSSKDDNPKWSMVDVQFVRMMKRFIPLEELKTHHLAHKASGGPLKSMTLFTRQRLSVQPVTREEFDFILSLEETEPS